MIPFHIPTPQGCDIQTFYGPGASGATKTNFFTWNKPVGVSHVYMLLIGAGGDGNGTTGGGSGAVTTWYGAAQHVPNNLKINCGGSQVASEIWIMRGGSGGTSVLLQAAAGQATVGGVATTAPAFAASGFYKSTAGQAGVVGAQTAPTTTFLSGGGGTTVTSNYGYGIATNRNGFFQMQPIIVGVGSSGTATGSTAVGCGAAFDGRGGPGMVLIASW
jgi:hypothetical protein